MLCYILHKTPIWKNVSPGKRNVRILCLGLVLYLFLHAIAYEFKDKGFLGKFFSGYFIYFIVADLFLCGIEYKLYYGRSIMNELSPYEKDVYDDETHTYIPNTYDPNTYDPNMYDIDMNVDMNMDMNMNMDVDIPDYQSKSSSKSSSRSGSKTNSK